MKKDSDPKQTKELLKKRRDYVWDEQRKYREERASKNKKITRSEMAKKMHIWWVEAKKKFK